MNSKFILAIATTLFLSACGSADKASQVTKTPAPEVLNSAPSVSAQGITVYEKEAVGVVASVSDSDGSVDTIAWSQTSGSNVTISDPKSATLAFMAPSINVAETLTFDVTATDNDGATAKATVSIEVLPIEYDVTLSGFVAGAAIEDAKVTLNFGNQTFETNTNAQGEYIFEVTLNDEFYGNVANVLANGLGEQSFVEYRSMLGSTDEVFELLESNNFSLNRDELFALGITNITTAKAGLMAIHAGRDITSIADYQKSLKHYDKAATMTHATAIYAVTNAIEGNAINMPDDVSNTHGLSKSVTAINQVIAAIEDIESITSKTIMETIAADSDLSKGVLNTFPSKFIIHNTSDFYTRAIFELNDDGSFTMFASDFKMTGFWNDNGTNLSLSSDNIEKVDGTPFVLGNTIDGWSEKFYFYNDFNIVFLSDSQESGALYVEFDLNQSLNDEPSTILSFKEGSAFTAVNQSTSFTLEPGEYVLSIPSHERGRSLEVDGVFSANVVPRTAYLTVDSNGTYSYSDVVAVDESDNLVLAETQGEYVNDGASLVFNNNYGKVSISNINDFADNGSVKYTSVIANFEERTMAVNDTNRFELEIATYNVEGTKGGLLAKRDTNNSNVDYSGWYSLDITPNSAQTYWYHFEGDTLSTYYWTDTNENGVANDNEVTHSVYVTRVVDGVTIARRFVKDFLDFGSCTQVTYDGDSSGICKLYEEFRFTPINALETNNMNANAAIVTDRVAIYYYRDSRRDDENQASVYTTLLPLYAADSRPDFVNAVNTQNIKFN